MRVDQDGFGSGVDAGIGVLKVFAGVGRTERVRKITGSQGLQAGAIEIDAIEMRVVGIFIVFAAVGGEIEGAEFFVERNDLIGDVLAGGDLVFEFAGGVEEVVVGPTVAFGPPD